MKIDKPFRAMDTSFQSYLLKYILPIAILSFIPAIYSEVAGIAFIYRAIFLALGAICTLLVALYPFMKMYARNTEILHTMPLVITHLSILSTSSLKRDQILEKIIERKEYGPIVEEFKRVKDLTNRMNISFSQSCRIQAKRTTSPVITDFLDRFANSSDAGESFATFLKNEQESTFQTYEIGYTSAINLLDLTKEVYISVIAVVLFMTILVGLLPFIQSSPITQYVSLAILLFVIVLISLVFGIKTVLPMDPIWVRNQKKTEIDKKIRKVAIISIPVAVFIFFLLAYLTSLPIQIDIALSFTALVYAGVCARNEQAKIKSRDENYPTFIRATGSTAGVVKHIGEAIERLSTHEFGNLGETLIRLNRRLKSKIRGTESPWDAFGRESGSNLIYEFTHMFSSSVDAGSDIGEASMTLNNNFLRIQGMRMKRFQSAAGYRWVIYGVGAAVGIVFSITFIVIFMMQDLYSSIPGTATEYFGGLFVITAPLPYIAKAITSIIIMIIYSIAGSMVIKDAEAGRDETMLTDIAGIAWVLAAAWIVSDLLLSKALGT